MSVDLKLLTFSAHCSFPNIINMKSKIKQDNPIPTLITYCIQNPQILYQIVTPHHKSHPLSVVPLSLSRSSTANATTIRTHHHHWSPHNPQPPQATSHKSQNQIKPKTQKQKKKKKKKPTKWCNPIALLNSGCCWVFIWPTSITLG